MSVCRTNVFAVRLLFSLVLLAAGCLLFSACGPTYPKDKLAESVEKLILKEHNIEGKARLAGKTLYLTIELPELATKESEVPKEALKKLQGAVLSAVRVSLSSDAKIQYILVYAAIPEWKLRIRIIEMVDDIKGFLYQKISKGDYEERMILDIATEEEFDTNTLELQHDLTREEFIAMLMVSQVNKLTRMNPFVGAVLKNVQLRFDTIQDGKLYLRVTDEITRNVALMWMEIIRDQAEKVLPKYKTWYPKSITLTDRAKHSFSIPLQDYFTYK